MKMASNFSLETRDQRIERMKRDNPGRPIELCTAVVDEMWDKKRESVRKQIPGRFKDAEIADLGYLTKSVLESLTKIFDKTNEETVGMVLCGPPGSGKTYAAYSIVKYLTEKNPEAISYMASYSDTVQALRHEFNNGTYDELGSVWDKLNNNSGMYGGLVLLDDVHSQKGTDFESDKLMSVINRRMDEFMPFIFTTNVQMEKFEEAFGDRMTSRIWGYCGVIEFDERDKRIDKVNQKPDEK